MAASDEQKRKISAEVEHGKFFGAVLAMGLGFEESKIRRALEFTDHLSVEDTVDFLLRTVVAEAQPALEKAGVSTFSAVTRYPTIVAEIWLLILVTLVPWASAYNCSDYPLEGCWFEESQLFDDNCNCGGCEDEMFWNCDNCECPTVCGEFGECPVGVFMCDGFSPCEIVASYVNDDWCDCPFCEDEDDWNCTSCGGCPECGDWIECGVFVSTTPIPDFVCDDNCTIAGTKQNDGNCDCVVCEDEDDFTCESCGRCPAECGDLPVDCGLYTTKWPTHEPTGFFCDDGCQVNPSYVDDDWCDCTQCEDESDWTCASCGGCPEWCLGYVSCTQPTSTTLPPNATMAPLETSSTMSSDNTMSSDSTEGHFNYNFFWIYSLILGTTVLYVEII